MAKKRKAKNHKRRLRELEALEAGKPRDMVALALALHFRNKREKDMKKEGARKACRGKVNY